MMKLKTRGKVKWKVGRGYTKESEWKGENGIKSKKKRRQKGGRFRNTREERQGMERRLHE